MVITKDKNQTHWHCFPDNRIQRKEFISWLRRSFGKSHGVNPVWYIHKKGILTGECTHITLTTKNAYILAELKFGS